VVAYVVSDSSVRSFSSYVEGGRGSITSEVTFLITIFIMVSEAVKFRIFFNSLHSFIFYLDVMPFGHVNRYRRFGGT
jgi:hypothetical protein